MSLAEQLATLRETMAKQIPEPVRELMHRANEDLRHSSMLDATIAVGDSLPAFELADTDGTMVSSQNLLERGAVVLTVFRGHW